MFLLAGYLRLPAFQKFPTSCWPLSYHLSHPSPHRSNTIFVSPGLQAQFEGYTTKAKSRNSAFSGSRATYCQEVFVSNTLASLVVMVLNASNIREQPDCASHPSTNSCNIAAVSESDIASPSPIPSRDTTLT